MTDAYYSTKTEEEALKIIEEKLDEDKHASYSPTYQLLDSMTMKVREFINVDTRTESEPDEHVHS